MEHPNIISEYENYGCEVFSIIEDVQKKSFTSESQYQSKIIQKSKNNKSIIISTGMKTAVTPHECFWTNAFIAQGSKLKQVFINPFGKPTNAIMDVDLDIGKLWKTYPTIYQKDEKEIISSINCRK